MIIRLKPLPAETTYLQTIRYQELAALSLEQLASRLDGLRRATWDRSQLRWHFERHGSEVGARTTKEYSGLAQQVVRSATHLFTEIYVDPVTKQRERLGLLTPWEREERIREIAGLFRVPGYLLMFKQAGWP